MFKQEMLFSFKRLAAQLWPNVNDTALIVQKHRSERPGSGKSVGSRDRFVLGLVPVVSAQ